MEAKFQLFTDRSGKFRFKVIAANGRVIGVSDGYKTMAGAQDRIESVKAMLAISSPGDNSHQAAPETKTKFIDTARNNTYFAKESEQNNTGSFIFSHCWKDIKFFPIDFENHSSGSPAA